MRLSSVEVIPYALPFRDPYVTARGTLTRREMVLLRLRDEEGIIGLGEAVPLSLRGGIGIERVVQDLRGLANSDVLDRALTARENEGEEGPGLDFQWDRFDGDEALSLPARCAASTALFDLSDRREMKPQGSTVGVRRDPGPVPCNATLIAGEPAAVTEDALRWQEAGFETFKLKVGTGDDVGQVEATRAALGPDARIRIDANAAWGLEEAKSILARMEPFGIEFVEQPVWRFEEAVELARETRIPLAGDESIVNREDAALASKLGAYRLAGIKLSKVGGIPEGMAIAREIHSYVSSALDGPVGIAAGGTLAQRFHYEFETASPQAPRFAHGLATQRLFASRVAEEEWELRDGQLHAPPGPGLGVVIDEDALQHHRL